MPDWKACVLLVAGMCIEMSFLASDIMCIMERWPDQKVLRVLESFVGLFLIAVLWNQRKRLLWFCLVLDLMGIFEVFLLVEEIGICFRFMLIC